MKSAAIVGSAQGQGLGAVDEDRRGGRFARPGQRNADVGVFGFAGSVDDAAHHRDVQRLDAGIARAPVRHFVANIGLDLAREFLKHRRGGAPAAGACGDQRHEGAKAHRLQNFLRDLHLQRAVAARLRGQRNPDRVADPLLQQHAHRGRGGDDALGAHARFGQAKMQRVIRPCSHHAIDGDEILHRRHFGRQDDPVARQADFLGAGRRQQRRLHHRLARHGPRVDRLGRGRVLVHQMGQQFLIERTPIGADPHRLAMPDRHFDDLRKLLVALVLEADIAGIDPVFVERLGAGGVIGEQFMADVMKIADQRRRHAHLREPVADMRARPPPPRRDRR